MKTKGKKRILALVLAAVTLSTMVTPAFAFKAEDSGAVSQTTQLANGYSEDPNKYEIYPVPHSVTYPQSAAPFTMTQTVNVVAEKGVDQYTVAFLKEILSKYGMTANVSNAKVPSMTNILLGIHGAADTTVPDPVPTAYPDLFADKADVRDSKFDPYILIADTKENPNGDITIVGKDSDCVYYGLATLQMMFTSFAGKKFLPVTIEDYSNVRFRGFIEGFYGGFDYVGRESQMRSSRDVKGNIYVFASKTDPYHSNNWDKLYPQEELDKIAHLVQVGLETKVYYAWSVHIGKGQFFANASTNQADTAKYQKYLENLEKLKKKFQQLYDVGVRNFHILNDDYNSGSNADVVVLLNEMNRWLKQKKDCGPIIYCPKGYNVAWAGGGQELKELAGLDKDIYIYWTGADVNSPIKQDNINWPYNKSGLQPVTWLNYPCSEHDKGGIYLGDISHYVSEADGLTGQMGIISNPVNYPEANKVAYFQLISWGWNRDNYTGYMSELWEDSFKYLQPEVYDAYLTIARNVSNCPGSGRIPNGFPESEYLADRLDSLEKKALSGNLTSNDPELIALMEEYDHILTAIDVFRANCANAALVAELEPWLKSLRGIVIAGQQALYAMLALRSGDVNATWTYLSNASLGRSEWDHYATPQYANKMAKAGGRRLQPFASKLIAHVEKSLIPMLSPGGGLGGQMAGFVKMGGKVQPNNGNTAKMFDGDPKTIAEYGMNQAAGDYVGVDLGAVKPVRSIDILQGKDDTHHDYLHKATLECSVDGENWVTLVDKVNSHHIRVQDLNVSTRYVRLRLLETGYEDKANFYTYIREFAVETDTSDTDPIYTNLESAAGLNFADDGGVYTLSANTSLTLKVGDYVGIRLPKVTGVKSVTANGQLPDGTALQYSTNGENWESASNISGAVPVRYARLVNQSGTTYTGNIPAIQVELAAVEMKLSFESTNMKLSEGSWDKVVDGKRETLAWTGAKQTEGQYVIYDLGAKQPVHDITLWFPENGDYPHYLDISIGNSPDANAAWKSVQKFDNQPDMNPPYRYYKCNAGGEAARYVKLEIYQTDAGWIKFNELEINKTIETEKPIGAFSGNPTGDFDKMVDGDITTIFMPGEVSGADGYMQYIISENASPSAITILQSPSNITDAPVEVQTANGEWVSLGTLNQGVCTFGTAKLGALQALRVKWKPGNKPAIAEILLLQGGGADGGPAEEMPLRYPNIYEPVAGSVPTAISVNFGTDANIIGLPEQGEVVLSTGSTIMLPIKWECESYTPEASARDLSAASQTGFDPTKPGTYGFVGTYQLENRVITNPGLFAPEARVTVRPDASTPVQPKEENLAQGGAVYVSGVETPEQSADKAVDGDAGTRWSGNYMKNIDVPKDSWIVVDLGKDVQKINSISSEYFNKVWPQEYVVQIASGELNLKSYDKTNIGAITDEEAFAGINAKDDSSWTTVYTHSAVSTDHPTHTVPEGDITSIPEGTRYIRLYFTKMNDVAGGHAIGLEELTVKGTRTPQQMVVDTNVKAVAATNAYGKMGAAFDELGLTSTVMATLADGTTVRLPVAWEQGAYNPSAATQTLSGSLDVGSTGVTNSNNVKAELNLSLVTPQAQSVVVNPDKISVRFGTAFDMLPLPQQAVVQMNTGDAGVYSIAWDTATYLPDTIGEQTVSGAVSAFGSDMQAQVLVTVAERPQTVVVRFDSNGGIAVPTQIIQRGSTAAEPPAPSRQGYHFEGWYADKALTQRWDFGQPIENDITLYANWSKISSSGSGSGQNAGYSSNVSASANGNVSISPKNAAPGTTVYITATPDAGYIVQSIIVTDKNGNAVQIKKDGNGKYSFVMPKSPVTIKVIFAKAGGNTTQFGDVSADAWYSDAVNYVYSKGLMTGTSEQSFSPLSTISRSMVVTVLWRLDGKPASNADMTFTDVKAGTWYTDAVRWAAADGCITGHNATTFAPFGNMTREQLATVLYRYAKDRDYNMGGKNDLSAFSDGGKTSAWAVDAMQWAVSAGILSGKGNSTLDPRGTATRAEVAAILMRFEELSKK